MVFATGDVEIHYKDVKLFADSAELNTETKDVYAEGNVLIQLPEEVVSAEEIRMNLDSLQGNPAPAIINLFGLIRYLNS